MYELQLTRTNKKMEVIETYGEEVKALNMMRCLGKLGFGKLKVFDTREKRVLAVFSK